MVNQSHCGKFVDSVGLGSITDLPYDDNSFDMVLCTGGPVSHLRTVQDRKKAIKELVRVAKPGACIFISVMARPAVLNLCVKDFKRYIKSYGYKNEQEFWKEQNILISSGDDNWFVGCSYAHFFWPSEFKDLVTKTDKNTELLHMVALEWSSQNVHKEFDEIAANKKHYKKWMDLHSISHRGFCIPDWKNILNEIIIQEPKEKQLKIRLIIGKVIRMMC